MGTLTTPRSEAARRRSSSAQRLNRFEADVTQDEDKTAQGIARSIVSEAVQEMALQYQEETRSAAKHAETLELDPDDFPQVESPGCVANIRMIEDGRETVAHMMGLSPDPLWKERAEDFRLGDVTMAMRYAEEDERYERARERVRALCEQRLAKLFEEGVQNENSSWFRSMADDVKRRLRAFKDPLNHHKRLDELRDRTAKLLPSLLPPSLKEVHGEQFARRERLKAAIKSQGGTSPLSCVVARGLVPRAFLHDGDETVAIPTSTLREQGFFVLIPAIVVERGADVNNIPLELLEWGVGRASSDARVPMGFCRIEVAPESRRHGKLYSICSATRCVDPKAENAASSTAKKWMPRAACLEALNSTRTRLRKSLDALSS